MGGIGGIVGSVVGSMTGIPGGSQIGGALGSSLLDGGGKSASKDAAGINANQPNPFQFLPAEIQQSVLDYSATMRDLASRPYQAYTGDRTADFTPDQLAAFDRLRGGVGQFQGYNTDALQGIAGLADQYGQAPTSENIASWMNPYTQNVIDKNKAEAVRDYQKTTLPGIESQAAGRNAFGGSRQAILEAEAERNLGQRLDNIQTEGMNTSFNQAMSNYLKSGNLAGQFLTNQSNLAGQGQTIFNNDTNSLMGLGAQYQNMNQNDLDVTYQNWLDEKAHPYQQANDLYSSFANVSPLFSPYNQSQLVNPYAAGLTQNQANQGNLASGLGGLLGNMGGMFSPYGTSPGGSFGTITWDSGGGGFLGGLGSLFGFAEGGAVNGLDKAYGELDDFLSLLSTESPIVESLLKGIASDKVSPPAMFQQMKTKKQPSKEMSAEDLRTQWERDGIQQRIAREQNKGRQQAKGLASTLQKTNGVSTPGFNPSAPAPQQGGAKQASDPLSMLMEKINGIQAPGAYQTTTRSPDSWYGYAPETMAVLVPQAFEARLKTEEFKGKQDDRANALTQQSYENQFKPMDAMAKAQELINSGRYADIQEMFAQRAVSGGGSGRGDGGLGKLVLKDQFDTRKEARKALATMLSQGLPYEEAAANVSRIYGINLGGASSGGVATTLADIAP